MQPIIIDLTQGWHGAAELSDGVLYYLLNLVLSELAIRSDVQHLEQSVAGLFAVRFANPDFVEELRTERDMLNFAAEVMADIRSLPAAS